MTHSTSIHIRDSKLTSFLSEALHMQKECTLYSVQGVPPKKLEGFLGKTS